MKIIVNGNPHDLEREETLKDFLAHFPSYSKWSAVALNGQFVPKTNYTSTFLKGEDRLEILQPAQGG